MANHSDEKNIHEHVEQLPSQSDAQDEKRQLDLEHAQQLAASYTPGSDEEKALVRKLDWRLVVSNVRPS